MKLLVTGGAGFIGSNFIHYILRKYKDWDIVNLDKLTYAGNLENLKDIENDERYTFMKGDICDRKIVDKVIKGCDVVVNFAAESHVDKSIDNAMNFIDTNIKGVLVLLDAAKKHDVKRFIQISTDEVYGSVDEGSSTEYSLLETNNPYSATKAAGDLMARAFYKTFNVPVIITRSSNNYGPYQYPEKVIPLFVTNLLEGKKVPLYGTGMNVRDWLHVEDNCEAIAILIEKGEIGKIYNIGGDCERTNLDLTKEILKLLDKDESSIEYVKDRPGHDSRYSLDSSKIKKLGWKQKIGFEEGLKETVKWYKENEKWWRNVKTGKFLKYYEEHYGRR